MIVGGRAPYKNEGFTLVEILVSMMVFSIVTLGMIPLISASLRSAALARSESVAKAVTEKGMEQIRSLPFYVSSGTTPKAVDVLDFYFPDKTAPALAGGYVAIPSLSPVPIYRTTCDSTSTAPACPKPIPAGYTMTIDAQFVNPGALDGSGNQTFTPIDPPFDYTWSNPAHDTPVSRILRVRITTTWAFGVKQHTYDLAALVGERGFQTDRVRGDAVIDYGVQVLTGFKRALDNSRSYLVATVGAAESRIFTRDVSEAIQTSSGGVLRLTRDDSVVGAGTELLSGAGAAASYAAPPDQSPAPDTTAIERTLIHPDIATAVGFLDDTKTSGSSVSTTPSAGGSFTVNAKVLSAGDALHSWVTNQAVTGALTQLRLAAGIPMFSVRPHCILVACPSSSVFGSTSADAVPISSPTRKVHAAATIPSTKPLEEVHLFPASFLAGPIRDRSLIRIEDFSATVDCSAAPAGASATAYWQATVKIYEDPLVGAAGYHTYPQFTSTANPTDFNPLLPNAALVNTFQELRLENPRVFNVPLSANDLYLFEDTAAGKIGYLSKAASLINPPTEVSDGNRYTSATIDGAIRIDTVPTDPAIPQSRLNISIGKLACEAIDRR
ncbi:MAG: hypothetical protein QOG54_433 [Actinomycetota bacterium]|jgi:prepilin-type N-terminal cleavage/methylation domain-containing protein|nr:hypothetical protein [Actinomycetota bacterium]